MIVFDHVTVTYDGAPNPALVDIDVTIAEGEMCLVIGPTGSGKSTLLRAVNGLVPHFTGGHLRGRVTVAGRDTATHRPRELADVVGVVGQDPLAGFVAESVEAEIAFGMEQLGIAPITMRQRVEEVLDLLSVADLRDRPLHQLSGGQQQRVAIASVLAAGPRVLVLDEPTSALDPVAAEEVLGAIARLVHDLGVTVLVAEHRIERILPVADTVMEVHPDGTASHGPAAAIMATAAVAPPVVHLARHVGWNPVPVSVRDARSAAAPIRDRLESRPHRRAPTPVGRRSPVLQARDVTVAYGSTIAVDSVDLDLQPNQIVMLMGRNGSGKTSLLWALQGAARRAGSVVVQTSDGAEVDTAALAPVEARRHVTLVPQNAADLLYLSTVAEECEQADVDGDVPAGTCADLLGALHPGMSLDSHPRDLSEGQRLSLVLAIQLTATPSVVLLDEPTRGLDYHAKQRLAAILKGLADGGSAVLVSTHDVEFVATCGDRIAVMAQGQLVADGTPEEVLIGSPTLAPQVARVLHPHPVMTVDALRARLTADGEDLGTATQTSAPAAAQP